MWWSGECFWNQTNTGQKKPWLESHSFQRWLLKDKVQCTPRVLNSTELILQLYWSSSWPTPLLYLYIFKRISWPMYVLMPISVAQWHRLISTPLYRDPNNSHTCPCSRKILNDEHYIWCDLVNKVTPKRTDHHKSIAYDR